MKRSLLRLWLFLGPGVLVSVAVAWGCVLWAPGPPSSSIAWEPFEPGGRWPRPVYGDWPSPQVCTRGTSFGWTSLYSYSPIDPVQSPTEGEVINFGQAVFQLGWPLRAIEYEARVVQRHAREAKIEYVGEVGFVPTWLVSPAHRLRRLPVRPVWLGLAVDTLFYAVFLWLLLAAPGALRRYLRARRGRCPVCAYPTGASAVCTECGAPVAARPS